MAESQSGGRLVAGRYRLIEPLGSGGMGTVWRAADRVLGREVAVKELRGPAELAGPEREAFTLRTFREARAAGRLNHPGVVAVYDIFEYGGHPWIVMQLVRSRTLGSLVQEEGPLPPRRVAGIGVQILAGLRAAHAAGVLHRDVKPDNVLITDEGRAVLTDFGIATLEDDSPVTRTGTLIGTPAFIAPERAAGGSAERASDLWSLGVTMFLAVEGRSPFQRGHALATLAAVVYDQHGPLVRAGPLAPVIDGLLAKDPAGRLDGAEADSWLRAIAESESPERSSVPVPPVPVGATIPVPAPPPVRRSGRWNLAAATGALVVLVGSAAGGMAYLTARPDPGGTVPGVSTPTVTVFTTRTTPPVSEDEPPPAVRPPEYSAEEPGRQRPARPHKKKDKPGKGNSGEGGPEESPQPTPTEEQTSEPPADGPSQTPQGGQESPGPGVEQAGRQTGRKSGGPAGA
ncbi:serine/threonine-protein kinase [Planotetraspora kaengkrachanensis]|uniref:non-specific serine/threonine protein kinase n=1 Tax=Planotetraspora kaengkrachanensis TaxID=575193 RepID=A0A8J3VCL5_9ACTN|nr:serine/threonine-protein kinase [Planotetraspora kaengkrachanensis]GIG84897.1 hypothetical protein Pka01_80240 [Planotetraspora kaengkrachanensis]